jgi:NAD(P)-dependent dehydrogenase (short-subunit alcohol dehydrogenase family)
MEGKRKQEERREKMEKMLQDRVAIITGSGRGIGKAAALLFASEGAKVVVSDLDPEPAEETASEIRAAGGEAAVVAGDVTDAAKQEKLDGKVVSRKIINVSSVAGTRGSAGQTNYSSAKAGVVGMAQTLAKEWGAFNVQANAVAYGWIDTRLTKEKESGGSLERGGKQVAIGIPAASRNAMTMMIPMGRPGTAEEAAGPILFLASPLSDYVSGQRLEITGGL